MASVIVLGAGMLACVNVRPPESALAAEARPQIQVVHDIDLGKKHAETEALPFVHDDYPRALAEAKRTKRPLFVDAWAPWCHSCQSMRAYVLTDPLLAPMANDFVWLTIDTEQESNAQFVEGFTNRVWPTLWVIDGEREAPVLRWEGTATAPELLTLLATAREGASGAAAETTMAFLRANQAAARGQTEEAEKGYRAVLGSQR